MKLDYKNFKKTKEDTDSATLQHPHGHEIRISKKHLDKDMKAKLAAVPMADGGMVDELVKNVKHAFEPIPEPKPGKSPQLDPAKVKSFQQGFQGKADGGEIEEVPDYVKNYQMLLNNDAPMQQTAPAAIEEPTQAPPGLDVFGKQFVEPFKQSQPQMQSPIEPVQAPLENLEIPMQQSAPSAQLVDPTAAGYNKHVSGINAEARALGAQGKSEADSAKAEQQQLQELHESYTTEYNNLNAERRALQADIANGHIDPQHYVNSLGGAAKVGTAIGLILGGIGGGIAGTENPALKFLNQQIDRDVEAQVKDSDKKQNLLHATMQQFGNLRDAKTALKGIYADLYSAKLQEAAANSKDPLAQARAMQAIGQLQQVHDVNWQQLAQKQAVMNNPNANPGQKVMALIPKEHQTQAFEELKQQGELKSASDNITKIMQDVAKLQTVGNRLGSPLQSKSKIDALNVGIMSALKPIFGALSESDKETVNKAFVGITDSPSTIATKTKSLQDIVTKANKGTPILDTYNIKGPKPAANGFTPMQTFKKNK